MEAVARIVEFLVTIPLVVLGLLAAIGFEERLKAREAAFSRSQGVAHVLKVAAAIVTWHGVSTRDPELAVFRRRFLVLIVAAIAAGISYNAVMARTCWLPGKYVTIPLFSLELRTIECKPVPGRETVRIEPKAH